MFSTLLENLSFVRYILYVSSYRAWWWEICLANKLAKAVRRVKIDKCKDFSMMVSTLSFFDESLMYWLNNGYTFPIEHICHNALDFSTTGRGVASLAFLAFILDMWSENSKFSYDFMLDSISVQLWQKMSFNKPERVVSACQKDGNMIREKK